MQFPVVRVLPSRAKVDASRVCLVGSRGNDTESKVRVTIKSNYQSRDYGRKRETAGTRYRISAPRPRLLTHGIGVRFGGRIGTLDKMTTY